MNPTTNIKGTPRFLRIHKARIARHWVWPEHTNQETEVVLIRKGAMQCRVDGIDFLVGNGGVYFVQPGQLHSEEIASDHLDIFTLRFDLLDHSGKSCYFIDPASAEPPHLKQVGIDFEKLLEKILMLFWRDEPEADRDIQRLIRDVIVRVKELILTRDQNLPKPKMQNSQLVQRAITFMKTNLCRAMSYDVLANHCCVSKYYLGHQFKQQVGISPLRYFQSLKMDQAKRLLSEPGRSIHEIAWQLGFSDPFYFSRVFKRHTGVSPQTFRNRIQLSPFYSGYSF